MTLSEKWGMTPFEVMKQDIDDFILFANYLINSSTNKEQNDFEPTKKNDGFWDF